MIESNVGEVKGGVLYWFDRACSQKLIIMKKAILEFEIKNEKWENNNDKYSNGIIITTCYKCGKDIQPKVYLLNKKHNTIKKEFEGKLYCQGCAFSLGIYLPHDCEINKCEPIKCSKCKILLDAINFPLGDARDKHEKRCRKCKAKEGISFRRGHKQNNKHHNCFDGKCYSVSNKKFCHKCDEHHPLTYFYIDKTSPNSHGSQCSWSTFLEDDRSKYNGITEIKTSEQFYSITEGRCVYCGNESEYPSSNNYPEHTIVNYIDRVDNAKGYLIGNIVACCSLCNKIKMKHSLEEFIKIKFNHLPTDEFEKACRVYAQQLNERFEKYRIKIYFPNTGPFEITQMEQGFLQ